MLSIQLVNYIHHVTESCNSRIETILVNIAELQSMFDRLRENTIKRASENTCKRIRENTFMGIRENTI